MNPQGANQVESQPTTRITESKQSPALRRFNYLFVYFPIALAALATISILVWITIMGFNNEDVLAKPTISAAADIVFVIFFIPAVVICGLLPLALILLGIQIKRRDLSLSRSVIKTSRRLQTVLATTDLRLSATEKTIMRPLIFLHAAGAYLRTLAKAVLKRLRRR